MGSRVEGVVLEVLLFDPSLLVIEEAPYFFHVDYSIDLLGRQPTQPVLAASHNLLAVHVELLPIVRQVLFLGAFLESGLSCLKRSSIDGDSISLYFLRLRSLRLIIHVLIFLLQVM